MRYKTRIVQENNNYIGHATLNDEIVYTTNVHPDPIMVTRELSRFISSSNQPPPIAPKPVVRSSNQQQIPSNSVPLRNKMITEPDTSEQPISFVPSYTPITNLPQRRCCGRG